MPTINKPKRKYYGSNKEDYKRRQKVYQNPIWKRIREAEIMNQPLCFICQCEGKITLADDVHHLKTFTNAIDENEINAIAFDNTNIVPLCKHHHWEIHHGNLRGATTLDEIKQYIEALNKIE